MKKISHQLIIGIVLVNILAVVPIANAASEFIFPVPEGNILLTNDEAQHDAYLQFPQYSLDFQAADIPPDIETDTDLPRCYTYGMPILAAADGIVEDIDTEGRRHIDDSYGTSVGIRHSNGSLTLYGHLIAGSNAPYVKHGDKVKQGQIIGLMGDTGTIESVFENNPCKMDSNYGTHLHFEIRNQKTASSLPISPSPESSFTTGKIYTSKTTPLDPGNIYDNLHAGKYPYVLKKKLPNQILESDGNPPNIKEVNFITPKPGEFLNLSLVGTHLNSDLVVRVQDKTTPGPDGRCEFRIQFLFLSRELIKVQCRMPLNLGPVATKSNRDFFITIFGSQESEKAGEKPLYSTKFDTSYGISGTEITPRKAVYYTPTRFIITGKNVHRTTIFYIEGCDKRDLKILEQQYDQLVLECLIQPLPNTDLSTIKGKSFQHLFLFKTKSRFNDEGSNTLSDVEDLENVVLSGYITMTYDTESRIDSIEPKQAIVGVPTTFTVKGNQLPYEESSASKPKVSLELCPGNGKAKSIEIIPNSYTPYGFDFVCTPEFSTASPGKTKTKFSLTDLHCDRINTYNWTEEQKNTALEKCYETDDREIKKKVWKYYDTFFSNLAPRKLLVQEKKLNSKQEVRVISALYDFIKREEAFQFQFTRKDGEYHISGDTLVSSTLVGAITTSNRQQPITITGKNLPKDLVVDSDECGQTAITYGSSEKFELVCLLKKVPLQELRVIHGSKGKEIYKKSTDIIEVYTVEADVVKNNPKQIQITVTGAGLGPDIKAETPLCSNLKFNHEPSKTELYLLCESSWGNFSKPNELPVKIFTGSNILLFENELTVQDRGKEFEFLKKDSPVISQPTPKEKTSIPTMPSKSISGFDFFGLSCEMSDQIETFLGNCHFSSPIIAESDVQAFYDKAKQHALLLGEFHAGLSKKASVVSIGGVQFIPLTGEGLISAEIPEKNLLILGQVNGIGINAEEATGYPLEFNLADYQGSLLLHYPTFDIKKARAESNMVIGLGSLEGGQMGALWQNIEQAAATIKTLLQKTGVSTGTDAGKNIIAALNSSKAGTLIPSIKLFQFIELIPETVAFYENFDLVARGILKTEPFVLKKLENGSELSLKSDLGSFDIDLNARDGILKIQGSALDTLSIFNNDILKTDKSLFNAGLTVNMKKDDGTIDLDPVEIHLPGDFASAKADAHIKHLFDPKNLSTWGNLKAGIQVFGLDLAQAGAWFKYDPNESYQVADQSSRGIFQLDAQLELLFLIASGKSVMTFLNHQLVMDLGGQLELRFLNTREKLADALSRSRIGDGRISTCLNSRSGEITFLNPLTGDDMTLNGGLSFEAEIDMTGFFSTPKILAISGQWREGRRSGLKYDGNKSLLTAFSEVTEPCADAPGDEFLRTIGKDREDIVAQQRNSFLDYFVPKAFAAEENEPGIFNTSWNMEGWKSISIKPQNGNDVAIVDEQGKIVPYTISVPGIWDVPGPHTIIITDPEAFAKTGYHIEIIRMNDQPTSIETRTVVDNQRVIDHFALENLKESGNVVELSEISPGRQLMINGIAHTPSDTRAETFTEEDLRVKVIDISSDPLPTPSPVRTLFPDIKSPALQEAVSYLVDKGVITGYPDGTFKPDQTINRAEALKMIFAAQGYSSKGSVDVNFPDVPRGEWYFNYVGIAKSAGIVSGYPDGKFRPSQAVNRAEFVKMAVQSLYIITGAYSRDDTVEQYRDLDPDQWYMPYIGTALHRHFLEKSKTFRPTAGMTRGDAALMIYKTLTR